MLLDCAGKTLDLSRPHVMGILNVTPDSFSDGGRYLDPKTAVERAAVMVEEGATIIDVGGESTRPGAVPVDADEQLRRILPVIEAVHASLPAVISVDTSDPRVMAEAVSGISTTVEGCGYSWPAGVSGRGCVCVKFVRI